MNKQLAIKLVNMLRDRNILEHYPYDTGQLRSSIQMLQVNSKEWIVLIGNDNNSMNGTPSNVYASITNDARTLGKNNKPNPNYRWVNKILKKWAEENMIQFQLERDDDDE